MKCRTLKKNNKKTKQQKQTNTQQKTMTGQECRPAIMRGDKGGGS